jgi:hypothetical protein
MTVTLTEAFLVGVILGLAIPTRLIHEWSSLMRQRVNVWFRSHAVAVVTAGLAIGALFICAAFVLGGIAFQKAQETGDCVNSYVGGSAPLAARLDGATQKLWDDFKAFQTLDQADPNAVKELRAQFFTDLDKERAAYRELQDYRDAHAPNKNCP